MGAKWLEYGQLGVFVLVQLVLTVVCIVKIIRFNVKEGDHPFRPSLEHIEFSYYLLIPFSTFSVLNLSSSGLLQLLYKQVKGVDVYYYMYLNLINFLIVMAYGLVLGVLGLVRGIKHKSLLIVLISICAVLCIFEITAVRMVGVLGVILFVVFEMISYSRKQRVKPEEQ